MIDRREALQNFVKNALQYLLVTLFLFAGLSSCDLINSSNDDEVANLHVKFTNDSTSTPYTIINIQLQAMGVAGEESTPSGVWSENILTDGKTIAPGESEFFDLEIPNLHWSQYRLGVNDGQGNEILLWEQTNYTQGSGSITHWGSDDRTVSVTLRYDAGSGKIVISGWSDFAGID